MDISAAIAYLRPGITFGPFGIGNCVITSLDGVQTITSWTDARPQPTQAEIDDAQLPAFKFTKIAANRAECERRIFARYPAGRQLSALAGMYDTANVQAMHDWISLMIGAENAAADLIEAATTVQQVGAVSVIWPV